MESGDTMMDIKDRVEKEGPGGGLAAETVAYMLDVGICPGNDCPYAEGRCDPRCPALVAWVEEVSNG